MENMHRWGNIILALALIAVVLLAVNLAITLPSYKAEKATFKALPTGEETTQPESFGRVVSGKTAFAMVQRVEGKTLTVTGTGKASAPPERVILKFSVITRASTALEAQRLNAEKMSSVVEALKKAGLTGENLETVGYQLNPVYEYPSKRSPIIVGYECSNTLKVTLDDVGRAGEIIDLAVSAGANRVSQITFALKPETYRQLRLEALKEAVKDAASQAEAVAEAANVKLVGPVNISIGGGFIRYPLKVAMVEAGVPTPIEAPEELTVSASVTLTYQIIVEGG